MTQKKTRKEQDWFKWKADCLISSFQRRHKKINKPYTFITKRSDYADILKDFFDDDPCCSYCDAKITKKNFSVDHATPLSRGGDTDQYNIVYCCSDCNSAKGEMTDEEWLDLLSLVEFWEDRGKSLLRRLKASANIYRRKY